MENNRPRTAEVRFSCSTASVAGGFIEAVKEPKTCSYELTFVTPLLCNWLTDKVKQRLEWEVDRSTPQKRVEDFVKRAAVGGGRRGWPFSTCI